MAALTLVAQGCDELAGPKPVPCRGYPVELDTLRIYVGPSGKIDSVYAELMAPAHVCGEPYIPPKKPIPDTVHTSARADR